MAHGEGGAGLALVETGIALLADDTAESLGHALLLVGVGSDVHLALDSDVGVGDGGGKELALQVWTISLTLDYFSP